MKKLYEMNGVMTYAHTFSFEVEARNQREAKDIAKVRIERMIDPTIAEFQGAIIDKPIEIPNDL